MAEGDDEADGTAPAPVRLKTEPWARPITIKSCDPPDGAVTLPRFVRDEAGAELAAIKGAFERLAKAYGSGERAAAADAFAAAVYDFHEQARRRLLTGEVVAFGRLPDPWCPYGRIPAELWPYLIWGNIGIWDGFDWRQDWQPPHSDDWKCGYFDNLGPVELAGGWDVPAEVAFTWMTNLRLDEVVRGSCTRPFEGNGWYVLGLRFARPLRFLVNCLVADVALMSDEEACAAWLRTEVATGPKRQSKQRYRAEAVSRWPALAWRAFERVWREVTKDVRGWSEPGRPRK